EPEPALRARLLPDRCNQPSPDPDVFRAPASGTAAQYRGSAYSDQPGPGALSRCRWHEPMTAAVRSDVMLAPIAAQWHPRTHACGQYQVHAWRIAPACA